MIEMFERTKEKPIENNGVEERYTVAIFLYGAKCNTTKCLTTQRIILIQFHAVFLEVDEFYVRAKMQKL